MSKQKWTDEFKREAIRQMETRGERTVSEVAADLGITEKHLYNWRRRLGASDAVRNESGETLEQEVRRLRRENRELRTEQAIVKKCAAYFAKDLL